MQIIEVKVQNLYGLHHYKIKFDESACIKIIHAPNGYGKTTLLKLIDYVMYYRLEEILQIPFTKFQIVFEQGTYVEVSRQDENSMEEVSYIISDRGGVRNYRCFSRNEYIDKSIIKQLQEKLKYLRQEMPIHLIRANRLLQESDSKETMVPVVLCYAKELKELVKNALAKSAKINEELDRNFPKRLLEAVEVNRSDLSDIKIRNELIALENKRKELENVGLLLKGKTENIEITEKTPNYVLRILNLYIEESKKKLSAFDTLAPKMKLMQEIINKRFTYKTMCLNQEDGFVFEVPYHGKLLIHFLF